MTFNRRAVLCGTIECIGSQSRAPERILIVDNGSSPETRAVVDGFPHLNIEYACMPENTGPAGGAHHELSTLMEEGYEWIYWGDDDDPPRHADTAERLLSIATNRDEAEVGAVGKVGQRFDWSVGVINRLDDSELAGNIEVDVIAGNQQLLVSASAVRAVGLSRKELFFGYEEPELCLRMRCAGYRLLVDGERMKQARIAAGRYSTAVKTSATDRPYECLWRNYYSTRNYINMMRTTFARGDLARRKVVKELVKSTLAFIVFCIMAYT